MDLNEDLTYNASISSVLLECKIDIYLGGQKGLFHHGHCNKKT